MEAITRHSVLRAAGEAVKLWALASAQYPTQHGLILDTAHEIVVETVSAFALNARRAMEVLPRAKKFPLGSPRWRWEPTENGEVVRDLWVALNRIIHARKLETGFVRLPAEVAVVDGGAVVVPLIRASTDKYELAFIDPFALSHAFLYEVLPNLMAATVSNASGSVQ